jgi:hypothetical protein
MVVIRVRLVEPSRSPAHLYVVMGRSIVCKKIVMPIAVKDSITLNVINRTKERTIFPKALM